MRFVVDMNLSPQWATLLASDGHDALHWREVGPEDASDDAIMVWAAHEGRCVLTADLDFAAMVAMRGLSAPSVVQLRGTNTDPAVTGDLVRRAINDAGPALHGGAILTIDASQARLRLGPGQFTALDES